MDWHEAIKLKGAPYFNPKIISIAGVMEVIYSWWLSILPELKPLNYTLWRCELPPGAYNDVKNESFFQSLRDW